ncbi:MAG: YifB family Mg chelatase-like AAA ATPase [Lentisphaerales bacterium]|nr:YifB family Mg chelatase-like AAA ATPase [Lentisphaerales bacterium]
MLTKVWSSALNGISPFTVEVEVSNNAQGNENYVSIGGLPDASVRESRERIRSAVYTSGLKFPEGASTVALAPADIKKSGAALDLPIALGLVGITNGIPKNIFDHTIIIGELALDGRVRPVKGSLAMAIYAREKGFKRMLVPAENAFEASVAEGVEVYAIENLRQAFDFLIGELPLGAVNCDLTALFNKSQSYEYDFAHVKGQHAVKRGLEIAAAGAHNILLIGPPGCGKSLLARSYASILPELNIDEALKVTQIHSIAGELPNDEPLLTRRPFRSPHHTVSDSGLLGGTSNPRPGEVSLAHKEVLFLDELPEYKRSTLEVMRQPMEAGEVTISRAAGTATFPADFMLLAAMNPCPCGHYGSIQRQCRCSSAQITRYRSKISGPLLDRIDIHLEVTPVTEEELLNKAVGEPSEEIRERVNSAREKQRLRFGNGITTNSSMKPNDVQDHCTTDASGRALLKTAINDLNLSARTYDRILRLARTIADLEGFEQIQAQHIAEAVQYRTLDRKLW